MMQLDADRPKLGVKLQANSNQVTVMSQEIDPAAFCQ